ncbi:lytic murein transglycosylase [Aestuariibacter sp. A3R04]|uniref:lytic murein transglycosylase n=1 Tax=Aestuariibacter sp. A3R04 TaxID=2841571 RepID=UPI001C0888A9|nr:lytic murein transglycosylase [Aestuariibacter sp. A3R04]MBU3020759.1 lytic murein transglycosylase [Aestuariibacter sp. A3R04]
MSKWLSRTLTASVLTLVSINSALASDDFEQCKNNLSEQAVKAGISQELATQVFAEIRYQPRVIELDRNQPEFVQTFPGYYTKRVNDWRINKGRAMYTAHRELLTELSRKYGVPAHYLVAFWGLETNFGSYKGNMNVLDSLTTLACDERRSRFFTKELMTAIKLLDRESLEQSKMVGSWAGAMGHTQFMPSAYMHYAIDGDSDGKVNLWDSEKDALASAANFLFRLGWQPGYRWGREITLPDNFDYRQAGYKHKRPISQWNKMGVTKPDGTPIGNSEEPAFVVVPAGHNGPAFIAYHNFRIIMRWNNSEFYAIAVGKLADQIAGESGLVSPLPDLPAYSRSDIMKLQAALNKLGHDVGKPDGIIGPATRTGIRQYQIDNNMIADGFPGLDVMKAIGVFEEEEN